MSVIWCMWISLHDHAIVDERMCERLGAYSRLCIGCMCYVKKIARSCVCGQAYVWETGCILTFVYARAYVHPCVRMCMVYTMQINVCVCACMGYEGV